MYLERTIWPVGHGGFYTEQFDLNGKETFTVAYDCGAKTTDIIKDAIKRCTRDETTKIDLLFISHFHKDHINGLPYLLAHNLVKHIILPQLAPNRILEAIIYNYITAGNNDESHSGNKQLQELLIQWAQGDTGDYITEIIDDTGEQVLEHILLDTESHKHIVNKLSSDTPILLSDASNPFWQYIPICHVDQTQFEDLKDALKNLMTQYGKQLIQNNGNIDWKELKDFLRIKAEENKRKKDGYLDDIKDIYMKVFKPKNGEQPHNNYSMPVYSGPLREIYGEGDIPYHRWRHRPLSMSIDSYHYHLANILACHSAHCLFTGDFEADDSTKLSKVQSILGILWAKVGLLQIPHHISEYNYHPGLYDHRMLCFGNVNDKKDVSFSISTYKQILFRHHCLPIAITEKDDVLHFLYKILI